MLTYIIIQKYIQKKIHSTINLKRMINIKIITPEKFCLNDKVMHLDKYFITL